MIDYIKGSLTEATPLACTIEAHGVGYKIFIPTSLYAKLPPAGQETLLYTSLVIRESAHILYGFLTQSDREFFETLTTVSGIGPKLAISLIGHLSAEELHHAIGNGDVHAIIKVPGIGKRTAERLVVELRDKLPAFFPRDLATAASSGISGQALLIKDAMSTLVNLGYNQATAQKAIKTSLKDLPEDTDLATLITASLKNV
jgi:Holliday junction DNA helicase RuvA